MARCPMAGSCIMSMEIRWITGWRTWRLCQLRSTAGYMPAGGRVEYNGGKSVGLAE